jgi:tripeptidyl-peptidase-1
MSRDRNHIFLAPKVRDAELLLNTHYHEFHDQTQSGHEPQLAVEEYSIPDSVIDSINFIEPTWPTDLGRTKPTRSKKGVAANNGTNVNCLKYMTPECLRLLYHIPHDHMEPHPNSSFGIYEISWVTWLPNDLDLFFSRFEPQLVGSRPVVLPVNGGYMQSNYTGFVFNAEPAVDFEYAMALTYPQPVINIQVGDYFTSGDLNNMLAALDASDCDALDPQFDYTYPVCQIQSGDSHFPSS